HVHLLVNLSPDNNVSEFFNEGSYAAMLEAVLFSPFSPHLCPHLLPRRSLFAHRWRTRASSALKIAAFQGGSLGKSSKSVVK
ncbi:hypothetical protein, partial [Fischerella thermalis]|uniref:hypothetical protein n=1 Tax=Fischerella thermalis TaxID=372787 RepID=UPI001CA5DE72